MRSAILLSVAINTAGLLAVQYSVSDVSDAAGLNASEPLDGFTYAPAEWPQGNKSSPNLFSNALLENLGNLQGTKPYIRVGGNTQDYALYNASLPFALNGTFNNSRSLDYPTTITIGPSYFESYGTWNATRFSHGFNMGLGGRTPEGWQTLLDTVPLACKALNDSNLYAWEYGNEPDLFSTSSQGPVRPTSWNESSFVAQWLNGTRQIKQLLQQNCPNLTSDSLYGYLAPSFAGTNNHLKAPLTWQDGINTDKDVKLYSSHNYISGATSPGVTLQGTLMNHSNTIRSVDSHVAEYEKIKAIDPNAPPHILGETNSLYNEGKPGLSNSFGAALWGVDFNLYCASVGIRRVHMHMGTNYRYASWQPIETDKASIGTKAPYYGNIAVAAMLGPLTLRPVQIAHLPLSSSFEAAYAAYVAANASSAGAKSLARILVLNLRAYNTTDGGQGLAPAASPPAARPSATYTFNVGGGRPAGARVAVRRLWANGSDAITGVTWDGWSYNRELDGGRPVRLGNVTVGETVALEADGSVTVVVPDSSAAMLDLEPALGASGVAGSAMKTSGAARRWNILGMSL